MAVVPVIKLLPSGSGLESTAITPFKIKCTYIIAQKKVVFPPFFV